jgi:hypothetical protein
MVISKIRLDFKGKEIALGSWTGCVPVTILGQDLQDLMDVFIFEIDPKRSQCYLQPTTHN